MCDTPARGTVPTSGLTLGATTSNVWYGNTCNSPGGHVDVATGLGTLPTSGGAYATLTAPADTTFVGLALRREVGLEDPGVGGETAWPAWSIYAGPRDGDHLIEHCIYLLGCRSLTGWFNWSSSSGVSTLHWDTLCVGGANTWCAVPAGPNPRATGWVYAIDVTLSDPFAPERVTWSGSALDGSALKGGKQITFAASDRGGGILDARVTLDGVPAGTWSSAVNGCADQGNASGGAPDYTGVQPCPRTSTMVLPVDTTVVGDGTRQLQVVLRDAAHNESRFSQSVTVDNVPPPVVVTPPAITGARQGGPQPGDELTLKVGTWTGSGVTRTLRWQRRIGEGFAWSDIPSATGLSYAVTTADVGNELRVVERASNVEGSTEVGSSPTERAQAPTTTTPTPTPGAGPLVETQPAADARIVLDGSAPRSVGRGGVARLTGRLLTIAGAPIAGAPVDVHEQLAIAGAARVKLTTIITDGSGAFTFAPTTTGSRTILFSYGRRSDGAPAAAAERSIVVRAGMPIRAARSTVPARGTIQIRGAVEIAPLPPRGTVVELQLRDGRRWRTISTMRTTPNGQWRFTYRLRGAGGVTYRFRAAQLRAFPDVPSPAAKSAPIAIRVGR